nr:hypothetical protein [Haloechinothrix halophila]
MDRIEHRNDRVDVAEVRTRDDTDRVGVDGEAALGRKPGVTQRHIGRTVGEPGGTVLVTEALSSDKRGRIDWLSGLRRIGQ